MQINYSALDECIKSLERVLNVYSKEIKERSFDDDVMEAIGAGVVQNFEFTYEQCWKSMKRWLEENIGSTLGMERIQFFRFAAENGLIDDVQKWMGFHRARNQTSHIYDVNIAHEVITVSFEFLLCAKALLARLSGREHQ